MRLLQPPQGFMLQRLGKISQLTASLIRQRPAAKLSDACLVSMNILTRANLTSGNQNGPYLGVDQIRRQLSFSFPNIVVPDYHIVQNMLNQMAEQLMIYNVGGKFATATPKKQQEEEHNLLKLPESLSLQTQNENSQGQQLQPKQSTPNLRITPYSSKDNDEGIRTGGDGDNTSNERVRALVSDPETPGAQNITRVGPKVEFSDVNRTHNCSSDNDSGLGDKPKNNQNSEPISTSRILNFFRGKSFRKNKKKKREAIIKTSKKLSSAVTTSPGSTQEIYPNGVSKETLHIRKSSQIHSSQEISEKVSKHEQISDNSSSIPVKVNNPDSRQKSPSQETTETASSLLQHIQNVTTTTTTTTKVETLTQEQAFDRGFVNRSKRQSLRGATSQVSSFQTGSQRKKKYKNGYRSSDTESMHSMASATSSRLSGRRRVNKSTRLALKNFQNNKQSFKTYNLDGGLAGLPERGGDDGALSPVEEMNTPKPAPRRENRTSNPGYASKPPIILPPPKEQKQPKPVVSKNSPSTPLKIEFRPPKSLPTDQGSVISNSVAGTGYSGLSSTLTLPRRPGFDGINAMNGINGINKKMSKTDTNLGNLPETASVPSKGKLHASTNSIASSTKPVINLSQYPQMGELANSLKDLKLSRQQWIDLFQEHNILDLLKKQNVASKPSNKSKSSVNLTGGGMGGPSNRTLGRLRQDKQNQETRQFRRQLKSADMMSKSLEQRGLERGLERGSEQRGPGRPNSEFERGNGSNTINLSNSGNSGYERCDTPPLPAI